MSGVKHKDEITFLQNRNFVGTSSSSSSEGIHILDSVVAEKMKTLVVDDSSSGSSQKGDYDDVEVMTERPGTGEVIISREWSISELTWRINDFDKIFGKKPEKGLLWISSPSFNFVLGDENVRKLKWQIRLYRRRDDLDCMLCLPTIDEHNHRYLLQGVKSNFGVGICTSKDTCIFSVHADHTFSEEKNYYTFPCMIKVSKLYKDSKLLLKDNTFRLCVHLKVEDDLVSVDSDWYFKKQHESIGNKYFTDFTLLRHAQKHSDVQIKCTGEIFYCHKAILSARSSVFDVMFDSPELTEITIVDMDSNTVSGILHYIYTGKVHLLPGPCSWTDLIHGADKYDLKDLKNYCFDKLFQSLTSENAATIALVAHTYNAAPETQVIIKDFCQTRISTLMKDPAFRQIFVKHPEAFYTD